MRCINTFCCCYRMYVQFEPLYNVYCYIFCTYAATFCYCCISYPTPLFNVFTLRVFTNKKKVGIDLIGPSLRSSTGNRYIIVCVDHLTRYVESAAVASAKADIVSSSSGMFLPAWLSATMDVSSSLTLWKTCCAFVRLTFVTRHPIIPRQRSWPSVQTGLSPTWFATYVDSRHKN